MNDTTYQENVARLCAKPADMRARLNKPLLLAMLFVAGRVKEAGDRTDNIKRITAYGKGKIAEICPSDLAPIEAKYDEPALQLAESRFTDKAANLLHAALGMVTEADEFLRAVIAHIFDGEPLDDINLCEEVGDGLWYQALACNALDTNFDAEKTRNMEKLGKRYPGLVFYAEAAVVRNLDEERKALEAPQEPQCGKCTAKAIYRGRDGRQLAGLFFCDDHVPRNTPGEDLECLAAKKTAVREDEADQLRP